MFPYLARWEFWKPKCDFIQTHSESFLVPFCYYKKLSNCITGLYFAIKNSLLLVCQFKKKTKQRVSTWHHRYKTIFRTAPVLLPCMLSSQPHYCTPHQNADAIFCLPWSTIIAVWLESCREDLLITAWRATSGHRHRRWQLKSEERKKKKKKKNWSQVLSKQALRVSVLTCPLWFDGLLVKIMRGTLGCAQYQSFARDWESSLPNNGLCVDCCCLACCTSLTRSQNGSAARRWKETPRQKLNMRRRHRRTCGMRAEYRMYCRLKQQHIYPHHKPYLNSDTGGRTFSRQWVTDYLESFPASPGELVLLAGCRGMALVAKTED